MINGKRVLALIPARGGSKGIPNKNIKDLCGKPLIAYSIEAALSSRLIDDTVVSTDSLDIANIAMRYGARVPFMRSVSLAGDMSATIDVVIDAVHRLWEAGNVYGHLVLLQPTSPLRTTQDIDEAINTYIESGYGRLASVSEVNDHPILIRAIENGKLKKLLDTSSTVRRQDMPSFYRVNGAIYIMRIDELKPDTSFNDSLIPYVMPRARSIDIDEPMDFEIAEYIMSAL